MKQKTQTEKELDVLQQLMVIDADQRDKLVRLMEYYCNTDLKQTVRDAIGYTYFVLIGQYEDE